MEATRTRTIGTIHPRDIIDEKSLYYVPKVVDQNEASVNPRES